MDLSHLWSPFISSSVVPVVIISSCGLLCLAFYNRLAVVVASLRSLQRERMGEYRALFRLEEEKGETFVKSERKQFLRYLDGQTADVLRRAVLLRNCLLCLIVSISSLVLTSFFIGVSLYVPQLDLLVLFLFCLGLLSLLSGLYFAVTELWAALDPVKTEGHFVGRLIKDLLEKRGKGLKK